MLVPGFAGCRIGCVAFKLGRVVDKTGKRPDRLGCLGDEPAGFRLEREIGANCRGPPAAGLNFSDRRQRFVPRSMVMDCDPPAMAGEIKRDCPADTPGGTGDKRIPDLWFRHGGRMKDWRGCIKAHS